jgi:CSLREA domain-containing protein
MSLVVQQRRKWSYGVMIALVVLGLAMVGAVPAAAATFTVNSTGDDDDLTDNDFVCDAQPGPGVRCTLRAAVQQANATSGPDVIRFQANLGTIFVNDDIDIEDSVTIKGNCPDKQVIDGILSSNGIFEISDGVNVFECLKLVNGNDAFSDGGCIDIDPDSISVRVKKVEFNGCEADDDGGAIDNGCNLLTVQNSKFINNFAADEGGAIFTNDEGGCINDAARVTVSQNTLFRNNEAENDGGAMANQGENSHQNINGATFRNNFAADFGGAVAHQGDDDSSTSITNSKFIGNTAGFGGAFCDVSGDGSVFVDVFGSNTFRNNFSIVNPPAENDFCATP